MQDTAGSGRRPKRAQRPAPGRAPGSPGVESARALLAQLAHALLARAFARLPLRLVNRIIACCALIALIAPLLLWIAWSKTGFFIIIASAAVAVGIIWLLVWLYPDDPF